jgi:hypothetical protein
MTQTKVRIGRVAILAQGRMRHNAVNIGRASYELKQMNRAENPV